MEACHSSLGPFSQILRQFQDNKLPKCLAVNKLLEQAAHGRVGVTISKAFREKKKAELELHNMIEWPWWYLVKVGLDHEDLFQP